MISDVDATFKNIIFYHNKEQLIANLRDFFSDILYWKNQYIALQKIPYEQIFLSKSVS